MSLKLARQGDVAILSLVNDIDMEDVVAIKNAIASLMDDACCRLVLDMSRVQHIHAVGFGILAESVRRLRRQQGDLRLSNLNFYVKHVLDLIGMSKIIRTYSSRDAAVESFTCETLAA